jgi:hypothetical protein
MSGGWVKLEGLVIAAGICGPVNWGSQGSRYALGHGR